MKNLSVCLLLLFVVAIAAVAQFRKPHLAAEPEGMKVTLLSLALRRLKRISLSLSKLLL